MRTMVDAIAVACAIRQEVRGAGQLARAGMGHDAADVVLRYEAVRKRDRPYRLYRYVPVDRSGERSIRRDAVESCASDASQSRGDPGDSPRGARRDHH